MPRVLDGAVVVLTSWWLISLAFGADMGPPERVALVGLLAGVVCRAGRVAWRR